MGFLEQERKSILIRQQEEQTKLEGFGKRAAEELARQRALAEDRNHASEDNKVICELLDNLQVFDIKAYIATVGRHTGYSGWPFLYTRDEGLKDQGLRDKLLKVGLRPVEEKWLSLDGEGSGYVNDRLPTEHPSKMFNGYNVKPQIGNWFSRKSLVEPQEPGIGLYFWKLIEKTSASYSQDSYLAITVIDNVFVRLVLPSQAIITGNGEHIDVTSLDVFDNALERGFKYPHRTREAYLQPSHTHIG